MGEGVVHVHDFLFAYLSFQVMYTFVVISTFNPVAGYFDSFTKTTCIILFVFNILITFIPA